MDKAENPDPVKKQEYALFKRASNPKQDPILTILRVHLLTEYYLERIIQILLPRGDRAINEGNLSYYQKLIIASSFDILDDKIVQCLKGLNKVRNECAHGIDKNISVTEVELIGRPLGKICTEYRRESSGKVPMFLHQVVGYLCGHLAAEVTEIEKKKISEPAEKKKKKSSESGLQTTNQHEK